MGRLAVPRRQAALRSRRAVRRDGRVDARACAPICQRLDQPLGRLDRRRGRAVRPDRARPDADTEHRPSTRDAWRPHDRRPRDAATGVHPSRSDVQLRLFHGARTHRARRWAVTPPGARHLRQRVPARDPAARRGAARRRAAARGAPCRSASRSTSVWRTAWSPGSASSTSSASSRTHATTPSSRRARCTAATIRSRRTTRRS